MAGILELQQVPNFIYLLERLKHRGAEVSRAQQDAGTPGALTFLKTFVAILSSRGTVCV